MSQPRKRRARAAALKYDRQQDQAPRLVAKGEGLVADRIIELAKAHDIPVHQDSALVDVLSRLDLDEQIPPDLYVVVAELLAFVYRMNALAAECGR